MSLFYTRKARIYDPKTNATHQAAVSIAKTTAKVIKMTGRTDRNRYKGIRKQKVNAMGLAVRRIAGVMIRIARIVRRTRQHVESRPILRCSAVKDTET